MRTIDRRDKSLEKKAEEGNSISDSIQKKSIKSKKRIYHFL
jgi:hypothetical protein